MKPWKKLEFFIAKYLNWKREGKSHYGNSTWDLSGDGYTGDAKHYKKHRIHSIKQKADLLYKDDVIIFTKVKGTHYVPCNILTTLNLEQFNVLLRCKRIAEKVDKKKIKVVDNRLTILLKDLKYKLEAIKLLYKDMKKIIKKMEEINV